MLRVHTTTYPLGTEVCSSTAIHADADFLACRVMLCYWAPYMHWHCLMLNVIFANVTGLTRTVRVVTSCTGSVDPGNSSISHVQVDKHKPGMYKTSFGRLDGSYYGNTCTGNGIPAKLIQVVVCAVAKTFSALQRLLYRAPP